MSDIAPSRGVEMSRLIAKAAGVPSASTSLIQLAGLASVQKSAAPTIEVMRGVGVASGALYAAREAAALIGQMDKLALRELDLAGSSVGALAMSIAAVHLPNEREIAAMTVASMARPTGFSNTLAGALGDIRTFTQQGIAAHPLLGLDTQSMFQHIAGILAESVRSYDDWAASRYPTISILPPRRDVRGWTDEDEAEETYEIERTDSGLYTARRGRGRPYEATDVKKEQFGEVLIWYLKRYGEPPSQRLLMMAIKEVLFIEISIDTVKNYSKRWYGSWNDLKRYCVRLLMQGQ